MRSVSLILVLAFIGVALCVAAVPKKGGPGGRPSLKQIFAHLDADGDGSLTEAEYVDNRIVTDKAKEVFFWIDADDDQVMTRQEVAARIDRVFKEMDADADGRVTIPEFMSSRWRWQVRIDWKKRDQVAPGEKRQEAKPE